MYSGLSGIYKEKMKLPAQTRRLTGTLNGEPITGKNVIANSAKILRQCSEKNEIKIGQVYIGQLDITLTNISIPWRSLKGKEIVLYEGLWIDRSEEKEESYWEDVELGHFFIDDAPSSVTGFECTCYDAMAKFDEKMGNNNPTGTTATLYQLITLACTNCGVSLGMTQSQINNMPNGSETLYVYGEENDMETYQDLISWCAQTMGANALINRSGQLVFKKYDGVNSVVETFTAKDRIGNSGKCSSFETFYTGISMVNIEESTTSYYGLSQDTGSVMNLGSNPLLQPYEGQTEQQLETKRRRILDALTGINYTPFDNIRLNRPCVYDLMDVIELTGGILGPTVDIYGCITKYEWTLLGGMKIQGAGANPSLVSAKSKTDKNIVGLKKGEDKTKKDVDILSNTVDTQATQINNIQNNITNIVQEVSDKISFDLLPPSGSGQVDDVVIVGADAPGASFGGLRIWRYTENEEWEETPLIAYGTNDIGVGATLPTGTVYLVYQA